jgi:hypothetical protein
VTSTSKFTSKLLTHHVGATRRVCEKIAQTVAQLNLSKLLHNCYSRKGSPNIFKKLPTVHKQSPNLVTRYQVLVHLHGVSHAPHFESKVLNLFCCQAFGVQLFHDKEHWIGPLFFCQDQNTNIRMELVAQAPIYLDK